MPEDPEQLLWPPPQSHLLCLVQVVEISSLTEHLLTECDKRHGFGKCHRCSEAVPTEELPRHIQTKECNRECHIDIVGMDGPFLSLRGHPSNQVFFIEIISAAKSEKVANRCPLCHENFAPGEEVREPEPRWGSRGAGNALSG